MVRDKASLRLVKRNVGLLHFLTVAVLEGDLLELQSFRY